MRTSFAPNTCVPMILAGSRRAGMKVQERNPLRAACAATEFAKFPVEEQETTSNPNSRACARATATTRSLKLKVGRQTASFLMYRFLAPNCSAKRGARKSGVNPVGREG